MPTLTENQNDFDLNAVTAISCDNKDFLKIYDETNEKLVWLKKFRLTVNVNSKGYGTVVATYDDILAQNGEDFHKTISSDTNGILTADIPFETEVTLNAVPKKATATYAYKFSKWDDNQTAANRTVTMTDNVELTANFKREDKASAKWRWERVGPPATGTDKLRRMMASVGYSFQENGYTFYSILNNSTASQEHSHPNWIIVNHWGNNSNYAAACTSVLA